MMIAVKNEGKKLTSAIMSRGAMDSIALEKLFEGVRTDEKKMLQLVRSFCDTYLIDDERRTLKLRPLQEQIIVKALCYPDGDPKKHRKMAILAPRGCGKSFALSVAAVIYMFFKRFRDLVFILAPSEDQAALIFNYVYRHFSDNAFLDSLIANYKFHNKPHIRMKGGTLMRRAPLAPSNQGQAIRGQHPTFLIVDESPLIDDRLFVDNVEPCIMAHKAPFINLGTPKSKENHMYRYLYDDAYADSFEQLHFTWRDAIVQGAAYSAPYNEEDMLTKMMEWGDDSIYWRTEYECEFVESVSNVFNPEKLKECFEDYQFQESGENVTVGVDIGKSINSTVISVWSTEKGDEHNIARLIYLEEITPKTGGHDIPYQRQRIMAIADDYHAARVIIDATGIGGAIEQDIRMACAARSMHFFPFIFTGGPRGSKTQVYRDYASYIQKGQVRAPNPNGLQADHKRLMERWLRQHIDLEYVMDTANKTERISAPATKHDDFCDSCVIAIHATLSMLPASSTFTSVSINKPTDYGDMNRTWNKTSGILTSKMRSNKMMKKAPRGI